MLTRNTVSNKYIRRKSLPSQQKPAKYAFQLLRRFSPSNIAIPRYCAGTASSGKSMPGTAAFVALRAFAALRGTPS